MGRRHLQVLLLVLFTLLSIANVRAESLECTGSSTPSCSILNSISTITGVSAPSTFTTGVAEQIIINWTGWHWGDNNHWSIFLNDNLVRTCTSFTNDAHVNNTYEMNCEVTVPHSVQSGSYNLTVVGEDFIGYCLPTDENADAVYTVEVNVFNDNGQLELISTSPSTSQNVIPHELFEFEVSVQCTGGICRDVNLTLDPIEADGIIVKYKKSPSKFSNQVVGSEQLVKINTGSIDATLKELLKDPNVEFAEPNYIYHIDRIPNDDLYTEQYAHQIINAELGWDITTGRENIIIAIVDTGIEYDHPDISDNIWVNEDETQDNSDSDGNGYVDDIRGYDFHNDDPDPRDDNGHGTHVAGTVGAVTDNNIGVAGVCWNCKVMPIKVCSAFGSCSSIAIANGIRYAADNGANVISISLGGPFSQLTKDAVDYAYEKGVVIVASAGNSASSSRNYPAGLDNVMAITATDDEDRGASFTNFGDWVDVAAPGVSILNTWLSSGYRSISGTSMAAPHVSGLAGLVLSKKDLRNSEVVSLIRRQADNIGQPHLGTGRINVERTLSGKNVIPMNAGEPFYTLDQNPKNCGVLQDGESCSQTWRVNTTATTNGTWEFFTIYSSQVGDMRTPSINISVGGAVQPPLVTGFTGNVRDRGLDTDGDGKFNFLAVDVEVTVSETEIYGVRGDIFFENWRNTFAYTDQYLEQGTHNITIYFSGDELLQNGADGAYRIESLLLYGRYDVFRIGPIYTQSYNLSDFDETIISFNSFSETSQDADSNGLIDTVTITPSVTVYEEDTFDVVAYIHANRTSVRAEKTLTLREGTHDIPLVFSGIEMGQAQYDGSWELEYVRVSHGRDQAPIADPVQNSLSIDYDEEEAATHNAEIENHQEMLRFYNLYNTTSYQYTQFEQPTVMLTNVYSNSAIDSDDNGLFNELIVSVGVNITKDGWYQIGGALTRGRCCQDVSAGVGQYFLAGEHSANLSFSGYRIYFEKMDAPYFLEYLNIQGDGFELAYQNVYNFTGFNHTDFELPPITVVGTSTDEGVDTDGDGEFDFLSVAIDLDVREEGVYEIRGALDKEYSFIDWEDLRFKSLPGRTTVALNFSGSQINAKKIDGPYTVRNIEFYQYQNEDIETNDFKTEKMGIQSDIQQSGDGWRSHVELSTSNYSYKSFESPNIFFLGPLSEQAIDTDDDGLFDVLNVNIPTNVTSAGYYSVQSALYTRDINYIHSQWDIKYVDAPSLVTFTLPFAGALIHKTLRNGPYITKDIYVFDDSNDHYQSDRVLFASSKYNYTQFEKPGASILPQATITPIDTDEDGLFNTLQFNVSINVTSAGNYDIGGRLCDQFGHTVAYENSGNTELAIGIQTLSIDVYGEHIYERQRNGPYHFCYLWLEDASLEIELEEVDNLFTTAPYTFAQFEHNRPPQFVQATTASGNETHLITLSPNATDPDHDQVTFSYSSPFNNSGQWQTTTADEGVYSIVIIATDGLLNTTQTATVTIYETPDLDGDGIPDEFDDDDDGDGIPDDEDALTGDVSHINATGFLPRLLIGGSDNVTRRFSGLQDVAIMNGNNPFIEFALNMSNRQLRLDRVRLSVQNSNATRGYAVVGGIPNGVRKTLYLDNINNITSMCIKDAEVESISEVSSTCTGANEVGIVCPSNQGGYSCEVQNRTFKISGLQHSAVNQQLICGDRICSASESCSVCSSDCGVCSTGTSGSSGSSSGSSSSSSRRSGGGGGSSVASPSSSIAREVAAFGILDAGESKTMHVTNSKIAVNRVFFSTVSQLRSPKLSVSAIHTPIATMETPVYQYLDISMPKANPSDFSAIQIYFNVPQSWITGNGIDAKDIRLYRYSNGWQELSTTMVGTSYSAITPGFSEFAIGVKAKEHVTTTPVVPTPNIVQTETEAVVSRGLLGITGAAVGLAFNQSPYLLAFTITFIALIFIFIGYAHLMGKRGWAFHIRSGKNGVFVCLILLIAIVVTVLLKSFFSVL